jgi:hypothetical protein
MSSRTATVMSVGFALAAAISALRAVSLRSEVRGLTALTPIVDLGEIESGGAGKLAPIEFRLRNDLYSPIRILRVMEQCDCTTVEATTELIPPGNTTCVKVRWDTRGKNGPSDSKLVVEYQPSSFNDDVAKSEAIHHLTLKLRANVRATTEPSPDKIQLSTGKAVRNVVKLKGKDSRTVVKEVRCDLSSMACSISDSNRSVVTEFVPSASDLPGTYYLTVMTSDSDSPSLTVPIELR